MKKAVMALAVLVVSAWPVVAQNDGGRPPPRHGGPAKSDFPEISMDEVKSAIAAKSATLLDANGTDSWKDGHIPGAIDFTANSGKLASVLPADKNALIVAYCGNPRCHAYAAAAQAAKALGYTNVRHMAAGIHGWKDANEPTEKGQ
jgi:rhodanese-related sulfurtransferase